MMWKKGSIIQGEGGFVLVTSLLVMMLVVSVGIMTSTNSSVEIQVSGVDKFHQIAFFGGDSGVFTTPKLIVPAMDDMETPVNSNFEVISEHFYEEVKGILPPPVPDEEAGIPHQLEFKVFGAAEGETPAGGVPAQVVVDVQNWGSQVLAGGGVEFGAGVEGASSSGQKILYMIDAVGIAQKTAGNVPKTFVNIQAVYYSVPNTSGGL